MDEGGSLPTYGFVSSLTGGPMGTDFFFGVGGGDLPVVVVVLLLLCFAALFFSAWAECWCNSSISLS